MNSARALAAFLACAAMCASAALHAQARGPANRPMRVNAQIEKPRLVLDGASHARKTAENETWLGRLAGRFRFEGRQVHAGGRHAIHGAVLCSRFGSGPGVRCVIQRTSPAPVVRLSVLPQEGIREEQIFPLMYFGINADDLRIQAMIVDREQAGAQSGELVEARVSFSDNWNACLKIWAYCWMVSEIAIETDGTVFMKIAVDHWFQGSKGLAIGLLKSGHSTEFEMRLFRDSP